MSSATARSRRREAAATDAGAGVPALMSDYGREQFAVALEASGALWRGLEAVRAIQQRTAREASARHRTAAGELRAASAPADLFATAVGLWQADLQAASRAWQEVLGVALEAQTEVIGSACSHVFDSESALETASAVEALDAVPGAALLLQRPRVRSARSRR